MDSELSAEDSLSTTDALEDSTGALDSTSDEVELSDGAWLDKLAAEDAGSPVVHPASKMNDIAQIRMLNIIFFMIFHSLHFNRILYF